MAHWIPLVRLGENNCLTDLHSFIHHVDQFQLQPASSLVYVRAISINLLQHWWLIIITALNWNCGSQSRHLLTATVFKIQATSSLSSKLNSEKTSVARTRERGALALILSPSISFIGERERPSTQSISIYKVKFIAIFPEFMVGIFV